MIYIYCYPLSTEIFVKYKLNMIYIYCNLFSTEMEMCFTTMVYFSGHQPRSLIAKLLADLVLVNSARTTAGRDISPISDPE